MTSKFTRNQILLWVAVIIVSFYCWRKYQQDKRNQQALLEQTNKAINMQSAFTLVSNALIHQTELVHQLSKKVVQPDEETLLVLNKLNKLAMLYETSSAVALELLSVGNMLKAGEAVQSVAILAKIVENLLKAWAKQCPDFKSKDGKPLNPTLNTLIDFAAKREVLTDEEVKLLKLMKDVRNEAFHELAVQKTKSYLLNYQEKGIELLRTIGPRLVMAL